MNIYKAGLEDIDDLIRLRLDYIRVDRGALSKDHEDQIKTQMQSYLTKHIPLGDFIAMIAKVDNKIASTAFMLIQEKPANPTFLTGVTGTLMNVITYPEYQKQGIAMQVIRTLIDDVLTKNISVIDLYTTEVGKRLYEKLGFVPLTYTTMRLTLQ